jgi:molybdopterin molybdotransferase
MTAIFQPASPAHAGTQDLMVDQALAQLAGLLQPLGPVEETEMLTLAEALDRVLAEDIVSPVDVPPHDNSAMDGYAFDGNQLRDSQPLVLRVAGQALAGSPWQGRLGPGQCIKVMTGAVLPEGLDTVVAHERTEAVDSDHVRIAAGQVRAGDNRRLRGEDLGRGRVALGQGQRLDPAALGLVASLGLAQVCVRRRLRVAYFSTGDEILSPGSVPREGAIYDSNRFSLIGLLQRLGVQVLDLGVVADDPQALQDRLNEAATLADMVLTSGGISAGEADHTRAILQRMGSVQFWRLAMRPGRPLAVGLLRPDAGSPLAASPPRAHTTVLMGLPGNPVAAMVSFLVFVRPALLQLMGARPDQAALPQAEAQQGLSKRAGRTEYQRGVLSLGPDGRCMVRTTGPQGSGVLRSMVEADCLIVLEHGRSTVHAGETVSVLPLQAFL